MTHALKSNFASDHLGNPTLDVLPCIRHSVPVHLPLVEPKSLSIVHIRFFFFAMQAGRPESGATLGELRKILDKCYEKFDSDESEE
ncbi:uncharacterized protein MELLADRAFT_85681 [Melampsora larici-populina 98AG31]|uniref:Uncharacterized protein n=1 Tax=Melampsora larici-populina (strain 98AG31 / pathotype 3-4-7) TaxID=747676 RepID=F4RJE3_MELLP|nr:uncharacterized protein MELLADRAFT_85681 [Melampsora larici-populina 98AG31]EGG07298.1 hypothetical protein MELLADRAFT_85681 [Melampsora larici-populina 98AG31]